MSIVKYTFEKSIHKFLFKYSPSFIDIDINGIKLTSIKGKNLELEYDCSTKISDFFLRTVIKYNYPLKLLGNSNLTKEMLEVGSSLYYIKQYIADILCDETEILNYTIKNKIIDQFMDNENVLCVIPGDGVLATAGYLYALYTKWKVISVDPIMNIKKMDEYPKLDNLSYICNKIENINYEDYIEGIDVDKENITYILIHIHSHCNFNKNWKELYKLNGKRIIGLSIPCCKGFTHRLSEKNIRMNNIDVKEIKNIELSRVTDKSNIFFASTNI